MSTGTEDNHKIIAWKEKFSEFCQDLMDSGVRPKIAVKKAKRYGNKLKKSLELDSYIFDVCWRNDGLDAYLQRPGEPLEDKGFSEPFEHGITMYSEGEVVRREIGLEFEKGD